MPASALRLVEEGEYARVPATGGAVLAGRFAELLVTAKGRCDDRIDLELGAVAGMTFDFSDSNVSLLQLNVWLILDPAGIS